MTGMGLAWTGCARQGAVVIKQSAGHHDNEHFAKPFPKLQILTIEGLLSGTERALYPDLSMGGQTFAVAKKEKKGDEKKQLGLI